MKVTKGKEGCKQSWQGDFPETLSCGCGEVACIAFVAIEKNEDDGYICDDRPEDADMWPHDAIAVAVYICDTCMKTTSIMNQA